jgi:hypothetical protein
MTKKGKMMLKKEIKKCEVIISKSRPNLKCNAKFSFSHSIVSTQPLMPTMNLYKPPTFQNPNVKMMR